MSLEGRLRDLGLQELCQLLTLSRKSGTLHITAQLEGRVAAVMFHQGAIVNAWQHVGADGQDRTPASVAASARGIDGKAVEATIFALMTWRDGTFSFAPSAADAPVPETGVRLATESLLVEATRRADEWNELRDRIPSAGVVPAFVDVEPRQLPLLHLVPQEWEILTRVDGQRDLPALAEALGRDVLDVARIVHGLIGTGLLSLRDTAHSARALPTPPSVGAVATTPLTPDLWIPGAVHVALTASESDEDHDDMIFDPISVGVQTLDGLPRMRTPLSARVTPDDGGAVIPAPRCDASFRAVEPLPVAPTTVAPLPDASTTRAPASAAPTTVAVLADLRMDGDAAARRGDFAGALVLWSAHLRQNEQADDADHVREAIALAARLHALLYSTSPT